MERGGANEQMCVSEVMIERERVMCERHRKCEFVSVKYKYLPIPVRANMHE